MTRVRVEAFTISLDGYELVRSDIRNPLGVGGTDLSPVVSPDTHAPTDPIWGDGGTTGIDDDFAARASRMLAPGFSEETCSDDSRFLAEHELERLVGDNPPYHVPTFILTHHARPPSRGSGTTFYFVTGVFTSA